MRVAIIATAAALLAACQGQQASAPPTTTVRATTATAPADLQLICASKAAEQYSVSSEQILPTASSVLGGGQYEVQLTLAGAPARCVIDDNAEISTLALVG
ncbi:MAG: hypothetical protein AAF580_10860 [Pseudomonadota bacterium]